MSAAQPIVVKIGGSTLGEEDTSLDDVAALRKNGRSAKQAGAEMSFANYNHFPNIESRNRATVGLEVARIYQSLNGPL